MEQSLSRDSYAFEQAAAERLRLSTELKDSIPDRCHLCVELASCAMTLARTSAMREEITADEARRRFTEAHENCPGTTDYRICNSKNLQS